MVHAHAAAQQALQRFAERRGELRALHGLLDRLALLLGCHAVACQVLRTGKRRILREMDDVQRALVLTQRKLDRSLERGERVFVRQRHRTRGVGDVRDIARGLTAQQIGDLRDVAQRGAHEQELRLRQREQRHLPCPAAVGIAKEMELVHGNAVDEGIRSFAQRLVRQNLLGTADDGRLGVDMDIARDHAHVVAAEQLHQIKELLADQRFNRRRVIRCLAEAHGHEVHAQRDQAFAAACGSAQNDVVAHHERHERFLLVGPQLDAAVSNPVGERLERLFLSELRVRIVQMVSQRAQLAGLVAFGLRGQRLDDVLAFEHMNISHRAVPSNYGTRSLSAKPQSNAALSFPAGTGTDARFDYSMIERRSGTGPKARLIGNAQHQRILIQRLGSYILPFRPLDRITEFAHTDLLEVIRIIEARKIRAAVFQKGFYIIFPGRPVRPLRDNRKTISGLNGQHPTINIPFHREHSILLLEGRYPIASALT